MAGDERRQHPRRATFIECQVEGASGFAAMRISDLSLTGCYIDTRVMVTAGSQLAVYMMLPDVRLTVTGTVVYVHPGIGFGMRFDPLSESARSVITRLTMGE